MQKQWSDVDNYLIENLIPGDTVLSLVLENNQRNGLPAHDVAANQGQLLALFMRMVGAKSVLEIGTLGAYSTIWMARELPPGGRLITPEAGPLHARVARENITLAGLDKVVTLREGPALDSLATLEDAAPFDVILLMRISRITLITCNGR